MQIRFKEYDSERDEYKPVTYFEETDYVSTYKLLKHMCDTQTSCCLEVNSRDVADTCGEPYRINSVVLVVPCIGGDLIPHISVDIEKDIW